VVSVEEAPERRADGDTAAVRDVAGPATGSPHLLHRLVRFGRGRSRPRGPGEHEELLFVLSGTGTLRLDGAGHPLEPEIGVLVRAGQAYEVEVPSDAPLVLSSVTVLTAPESPVAVGAQHVTVRLADQDAAAATADREFRIVTGPATGCARATQFVGSIPPGRAPVHFHRYDEVVLVLDGEGAAHLEGQPEAPIAAGSCILLPAGVRHCVENRGDGPLRVLGVFRPAGSPSEAYYPDGTPAVRSGGTQDEE
jgi:mannose-6-phosphate isomerase-like protein (cupin superfamily)